MFVIPKIKASLPSFRIRCLSCCTILLLFCLAGGAPIEVVAQRTGGRKPADSGKGRIGAPLRPAVEEPKPEKRIIVQPNEGYLALVTNNGASVVLRRGKISYPFTVEKNNLLSVSKLTPGRYQLDIKLNDDFEPVSEMVEIKKGKLTTLDKSLRSKYGTLILSLGAQAAPDVTVKLNGEPVEPQRQIIEEGRILVKRVPIGVQEISLSKPKHDDWSKNITVRAGECENLIVAAMNRAAVTLTIKSLPKARCYLGSELKGEVLENGRLIVRNLEPGEADLLVKLDGYEDYKQKLALSLDQREVSVEAKLTAFVDDAEIEMKFDPQMKNWSHQVPEWRLNTGKPAGWYIKGEAVALVYVNPNQHHYFNCYANFRLQFILRFRKNAAWVVRAQDRDNYYLFELDRSNPAKVLLSLYLYQNGRRIRTIDEQEVFADLSDENASYPITLTAQGKTFSHTVNTRKGKEVLGGVFTDQANTFPRGGVGLRGLNGSEVLVQEFWIQLLK